MRTKSELPELSDGHETSKERQIFAEAIELAAESRAAFLKEACGTEGIIHRDLKPSNVLAAEYDPRVLPRIIDFAAHAPHCSGFEGAPALFGGADAVNGGCSLSNR